MPERTVLFDTVPYFVHDDLAPNKRQRLTAKKGDKIELTDSEAKRLEALGAVGSEDELAAQAAGEATPVRTPTSAGSLRTMTVDQMVRFMARADEKQADSIETWLEELVEEVAAEDEATAARLAAAREGETPPAPTTTSDEDLAAMNSGELIAHLSQNPGDIDRVEAANEGRDNPYSTVTSAIEKTREELAAAT